MLHVWETTSPRQIRSFRNNPHQRKRLVTDGIMITRKSTIGEVIHEMRQGGVSLAELGWAVLGKDVSRAAAESWARRIQGCQDLKVSELLAICRFFEKPPSYFLPSFKCSDSIIPDDVLEILERIYRSDEEEMRNFVTRTLTDFLEVIHRTPSGRKKRSPKQKRTKAETKKKSSMRKR